MDDVLDTSLAPRNIRHATRKAERLRRKLEDRDAYFVHAEGPAALLVRHSDGSPAYAVMKGKLVPFSEWVGAGSPIDPDVPILDVIKYQQGQIASTISRIAGLVRSLPSNR